MKHMEENGYKMRPARAHEANMFFARTEIEYEWENCVGYLRMDFGSSGTEFWHTWNPLNNDVLNTEHFKQDFYPMMDLLREGPLQSRKAMCEFTEKNDGVLSGEFKQFGYVIESEGYRYYARFNPIRGDYNGYIYAYKK